MRGHRTLMVKSEPSAQQLNRLIPSCHGRCSEPRPWIVLDILTSRPDLSKKHKVLAEAQLKSTAIARRGERGSDHGSLGRRPRVGAPPTPFSSPLEPGSHGENALPRLTDTPVWRVVGVVLLAVRSSRDSTSSSLSLERERGTSKNRTLF